MNCRSMLFVATCALTTFALTSTATGQEVASPPEVAGPADRSTSNNAGKTRLDLSVGLKGGVVVPVVSEVPELTPQQYLDYGQPATGDDSGFFGAAGVGPGIGLALEARIIEMLGLETGFYYTQDDATGWLDKNVNGVNRGRISSEQTTSALHIPLLFKINAKTETVKPFLGLGFEFVLQQDSSIDYHADNDDLGVFVSEYERRNSITPSNYTLFQLTTGVEIDLGDIRIPVEIRGGYNLGFDERFDERVDAQDQGDGTYDFVYNGEYQAHFGFFVGVMYDYDLYL